jgi:hypothetical protein
LRDEKDVTAPSDAAIEASSLAEFRSGAEAKFGPGTLGKTKYAAAYTFRASNNKITTATLTLQLDSQTAHWVGPGADKGKAQPSPDAANRNAISVVESLNRQHEQHHIDTTKAAFHKLKDDIEKRMVGQTQTEADTTFNEMTSALTAACETLHSTEGLIEVDAVLHATVKAQGAGGCD